MKRWFSVLIALALTTPLYAQSVSIPTEAAAEVNEWVILPFKVDGGSPKWKVDAGLVPVNLSEIFGEELAAKATSKIFKAKKAGKYQVWAWNAKGDIASELASCTVTIGTPNPGPKPDPDPGPDPLPVSGQLFVSVWRDTSLQTPAQATVILGTKWRDYCRAKKYEFRVYGTLSEPAKFTEFKAILEKATLPCVVLQKSNGEIVDAFKLPASDDELTAHLKKYGG